MHIVSPEKSEIELQIKRIKFRSPLVGIFSYAKCLRPQYSQYTQWNLQSNSAHHLP